MFFGQSWRRVIKFFKENPGATAFLVFVIAFVLAMYLQLNGAFADPDSFYHARMATLIRDQGNVTSFRWLPYTVLSDTYVNQHFLYHVFLIPFVTIVSPLVGIKVAAVFLVAAMATVFYSVLRAFQVRGAFVFTLLLLAVNPFMFRMGLAKTPSLAITMLFIGLWLLFTFRHKLLFFFAWLYVWVYGGFSLLLVAAACFAVVGEFGLWLRRRRERRLSISEWISALTSKSVLPRRGWYLRGFVAALLGIVIGLIANPAFPTNMKFYQEQLVKIGIINYQKTIGVGGEWYPYPISDLLPSTVFVSIALLIGLVAVFFAWRRQSVRSWTLLCLTIFLFLFTLKSRRYVEYYVPVAMAFGAFAISDGLGSRIGRELISDTKRVFYRHTWTRALGVIIIVYLCVGTIGVAVRDLRNVRRDLAGGIPANSMAKATAWLKANAPVDSIIMHSDWDEFPILFYNDPTHRYIAGLDATFFYERNPDLYWKWTKLTSGTATPLDAQQMLTADFRVSYVLLTLDHTGMNSMLTRTPGVRATYEDSEVKIFQVLY